VTAVTSFGLESVSLQFLGARDLITGGNFTGLSSKGSAAIGEASMNTLIHLKRHGEVHFHLHPLLETFSLITSFLVAVLVVLMLVSSAR
jgi:hypothetical protein